VFVANVQVVVWCVQVQRVCTGWLQLVGRDDIDMGGYNSWAVTTSSQAEIAIMPTNEHESEKEHMGIDISCTASAMSSKHATQNIAPVVPHPNRATDQKTRISHW